MIRNFKGKLTQKVAKGQSPKGFPSDLVRISVRKLAMLNNAVELRDLRSPPGNHLEALAGARKGQYSIRLNQQWRICFVWTQFGPGDVEIIDYH